MASKSEETDARRRKMADDMKPMKGKLRNLSITPADNGYTVETEREEAEEKKSGKDDGGATPVSTSYKPPQKHVFTDKAGVMAHVEKHLG